MLKMRQGIDFGVEYFERVFCSLLRTPGDAAAGSAASCEHGRALRLLKLLGGLQQQRHFAFCRACFILTVSSIVTVYSIHLFSESGILG